MKKLIKKILKEYLDYWGVSDASPENDEYDMSPLNEDMDEMGDRKQMFLDKIIKVMKDDFPLIKNLKDYGFYEQLSEEELKYVFSEIFGEPVTINKMIHRFIIYDENGNKIYYENSYGYWQKFEYDDNGNEIYYEDSDGHWEKREYDENGNVIYYEDSDGEILDNR